MTRPGPKALPRRGGCRLPTCPLSLQTVPLALPSILCLLAFLRSGISCHFQLKHLLLKLGRSCGWCREPGKRSKEIYVLTSRSHCPTLSLEAAFNRYCGTPSSDAIAKPPLLPVTEDRESVDNKNSPIIPTPILASGYYLIASKSLVRAAQQKAKLQSYFMAMSAYFYSSNKPSNFYFLPSFTHH